MEPTAKLSQMENIHRLALKKSWTSIINSLSLEDTSSVIDYLVERDILTICLSERIKCERHILEQNRTFLTILQRRGPRAFETFIEALLHNGLDQIAEIILSHVSKAGNTKTHKNGAETNITAQTITGSNDETKDVTTNTTDTTECQICMDNKISVAFIPCGHVYCARCGDIFLKQNSCCYCKQNVTSLIKIYV